VYKGGGKPSPLASSPIRIPNSQSSPLRNSPPDRSEAKEPSPILSRYVESRSFSDMFRFNFPVRVRRRPCCLGLGCEAIRFRAAAYSRFAGRDVDLRAVMW